MDNAVDRGDWYWGTEETVGLSLRLQRETVHENTFHNTREPQEENTRLRKELVDPRSSQIQGEGIGKRSAARSRSPKRSPEMGYYATRAGDIAAALKQLLDCNCSASESI